MNASTSDCIRATRSLSFLLPTFRSTAPLRYSLHRSIDIVYLITYGRLFHFGHSSASQLGHSMRPSGATAPQHTQRSSIMPPLFMLLSPHTAPPNHGCWFTIGSECECCCFISCDYSSIRFLKLVIVSADIPQPVVAKL